LYAKKPTLGIFNEAEKIKKKIKSMTPVELSKFKKKAESDAVAEDAPKSEADSEESTIAEKGQFVPEEKQNGDAKHGEEEDEKKMFKDYVELKKKQKVKTYEPIGGWLIP